ncbi:MAG TPA: hypothetical protein VIZ18_00060 [Ktedonobacteraceae bacterium]
MLRRIIIAYGLLCLVGAAVLFIAHVTIVLVIYLAVNGLLIVGGILFERRGYHPHVSQTGGNWQKTGERFIDPTTKREVEVYYNPQTGERDYRDAGPQE